MRSETGLASETLGAAELDQTDASNSIVTGETEATKGSSAGVSCACTSVALLTLGEQFWLRAGSGVDSPMSQSQVTVQASAGFSSEAQLSQRWCRGSETGVWHCGIRLTDTAACPGPLGPDRPGRAVGRVRDDFTTSLTAHARHYTTTGRLRWRPCLPITSSRLSEARRLDRLGGLNGSEADVSVGDCR